jgi:hypothetical protein
MRSIPLLALLLLAGCHMILPDQRTFDPHAGMKPVPPKGPAPKFAAGPQPLITISYATPDPAYADELATAVKHALAVKANVLFTVQTLVPLQTTPADQAAAMQAATTTSREIAEAIVADGADVGQIELALRADPGVKADEVRVFVH